jgi:serine/threonine protein kinase
MAVATLMTGGEIDYIDTDSPKSGSMKSVYFTGDNKHVVAFFNDPNTGDDNRLQRLNAVIGPYNPTTKQNGSYWKDLFCWPIAVVSKPSLGVVLPNYSTLPGTYFFSGGCFKGKEKEGSFFTSQKFRRKILETAPEEMGDWRNFLSICILMSRAIRRLHAAGLAHSDLSSTNILIDPNSGRCVVIDVDSLVVPNLFQPDVLGTPNYIAPEVLKTQFLPPNDNEKVLPNIRTDLHALAVLVYEYLFFRHPLIGPKVYAGLDGHEQTLRELGEHGVFVEHPSDHSNRIVDMEFGTSDLGEEVKKLFEKAFVEGLKNPNVRPTAAQWEKCLMAIWDNLYPCDNDQCWGKWFTPLNSHTRTCFHCKGRIASPIPVLTTFAKARTRWVQDGKVVIFHGKEVNTWHVFDNKFPGESADRTRLGYFFNHSGKWFLFNEKLQNLKSPNNNPVPPGGNNVIELRQDCEFLLSDTPHGRKARIDFI